MVIPHPPTAQESAQGNSRIIVGYLVGIVSGKPTTDHDHQVALMGRIYETTHAAADPTDPFHTEYRAMYDSALGEDIALFLKAFNDLCERFREESRRKKMKLVRFSCQGGEQKILLAGLEKLKKATEGSGGFHFPYPGMGQERVNTHLCTGR